MRSFSFVVALLFAFVATSYAWPELHLLEARKGHKNGTSNGNKTENPTNKACSKMAKLTKLTELAANQTKLDNLVTKGKLNQTEVDAIKAKAANATDTLKTMQANTTLVGECAVVDAHKKTLGECKQMKKLNKLANLANNQTAMDALAAKKKLNDTGMAKLMDNIKKAQAKLQTLQSNTTLTDLCSKETNQQKGSNAGASSTGAAGAAATGAKSGAAGLTIQTMPYVFVPAIAGIFAFLL